MEDSGSVFIPGASEPSYAFMLIHRLGRAADVFAQGILSLHGDAPAFLALLKPNISVTARAPHSPCLTNLILLPPESQHNWLCWLRIQGNLNPHLLPTEHPLPILSQQVYAREFLEQATDHVFHLHPSEIPAKTDARSMIEREKFPELWRPCLPTKGVEDIGRRAN